MTVRRLGLLKVTWTIGVSSLNWIVELLEVNRIEVKNVNEVVS